MPETTKAGIPPTGAVEDGARASAFPLLGFVLFAFFFAASTPSPLFVIFQRHWGFSAGMLTVAFSAYAVVLLAALLVAGALSDHMGRRPVIMLSLALQTLAMAWFAQAADISELIIARCIQGLATGVASGALSAAVIEAAPNHRKMIGTLITSIAPLGGLATGSPVTGLLIYCLPHAEVMVFVTLAVLFLSMLLGVAFIPETAVRRPGIVKSLRPRVSVNVHARKAYLQGVPLLLSIWALCGLYMSLAPSILYSVFAFNSNALNGLTVAALCGPAAFAAAVFRGLPSVRGALSGATVIVVGLGVLILSLARSNAALFFSGTVIAGIGSGMGFSAVLRTLVPLADEHDRAELFAAIFVACYLSLSLPPMIAGFSVGTFGLLDTAGTYMLVLLAVALCSSWTYWTVIRRDAAEKRV